MGRAFRHAGGDGMTVSGPSERERIDGLFELAFRRLITRALREAWTRPVALTGPAIALIKSHPVVATAIRSAMTAWPQRLAPGACGPTINMLATDELTRAVLDTALINDPELERLLTSLRTMLLDAAAHATSDVSR